jgi:hypothetical protein
VRMASTGGSSARSECSASGSTPSKPLEDSPRTSSTSTRAKSAAASAIAFRSATLARPIQARAVRNSRLP